MGIKTVQDPSDHTSTLNLLREAAIMGQFCHENIIKLYGVVSIGKPVSVVYVFVVIVVFVVVFVYIFVLAGVDYVSDGAYGGQATGYVPGCVG